MIITGRECSRNSTSKSPRAFEVTKAAVEDAIAAYSKRTIESIEEVQGTSAESQRTSIADFQLVFRELKIFTDHARSVERTMASRTWYG